MIRLDPEGTSLVLAGAWNPAILTPDWILVHGLNREKGASEVIEAMIPVGAGGGIAFPRFTMPGFRYVCRPDSLILVPSETSTEKLESLEALCDQILTRLAHTPLQGLGHNFEFIDEEPDASALSVFSAASQDLVAATQGWEQSSSKIVTSFNKAPAIVNITRSYDGSKLQVSFNFHHQLTNADEARAILTGSEGDRLAVNLDHAKTLMKNLYRELQE